jgi:hypothetical protein
MYPYTHVVNLTVTTAGTSGLASGGSAGAYSAFMAGTSGVIVIQTIYGETAGLTVEPGFIYPIEILYLLSSSAGTIVGLK